MRKLLIIQRFVFCCILNECRDKKTIFQICDITATHSMKKRCVHKNVKFVTFSLFKLVGNSSRKIPPSLSIMLSFMILAIGG